MNVEVISARDHQSLIRNLMQPYLHDLSEYADDRLGDDGTFDLGSYFDAFWQEPERHPFLIINGGELAGFALVRELGEGAFSMSEFFVTRAHRRRRVGRDAAFALFDSFPGTWHVAQDSGNFAAQSFWRGIIGSYTGGDYEEGRSDSQPTGPQQVFSSSGRTRGTVEVRPYRQGDRADVVGVWHRSGLEAYPYLPAFQALTPVDAERIFTERIEPTCDIQVALIDGEIVAYLAMRASYIDRLYVDPAYQGRGVGTKLLDVACELSPSRLELHTHNENKTARNLYEKRGFKAVKFGISPEPENAPDVEYHWRRNHD